jgi:hypothetical protein
MAANAVLYSTTEGSLASLQRCKDIACTFSHTHMTEPDIIILERKLSDAKQATAGAKY